MLTRYTKILAIFYNEKRIRKQVEDIKNRIKIEHTFTRKKKNYSYLNNYYYIRGAQTR